MAPRSCSTPISSSPNPSTLPTTPTAESTWSTWTVSSPFGVFMVTEQPSPDVSTFVTSVPVLTVTPIFLYARASSFDTAASSTGTSRSWSSTMVTSVPMWWYT